MLFLKYIHVNKIVYKQEFSGAPQLPDVCVNLKLSNYIHYLKYVGCGNSAYKICT